MRLVGDTRMSLTALRRSERSKLRLTMNARFARFHRLFSMFTFSYAMCDRSSPPNSVSKLLLTLLARLRNLRSLATNSHVRCFIVPMCL